MKRLIEMLMFGRRGPVPHTPPAEDPELIAITDKKREIEASVTLLRSRVAGLRATLESNE